MTVFCSQGARGGWLMICSLAIIDQSGVSNILSRTRGKPRRTMANHCGQLCELRFLGIQIGSLPEAAIFEGNQSWFRTVSEIQRSARPNSRPHWPLSALSSLPPRGMGPRRSNLLALVSSRTDGPSSSTLIRSLFDLALHHWRDTGRPGDSVLSNIIPAPAIDQVSRTLQLLPQVPVHSTFVGSFSFLKPTAI